MDDAAHTGDTFAVRCAQAVPADGLGRTVPGAETAGSTGLARLGDQARAPCLFIGALSRNGYSPGNIRSAEFLQNLCAEPGQLRPVQLIRPACRILVHDGVFRHGGHGGEDPEARLLRGVLQFHKGVLIGPVAIYADDHALRLAAMDQ